MRPPCRAADSRANVSIRPKRGGIGHKLPMANKFNNVALTGNWRDPKAGESIAALSSHLLDRGCGVTVGGGYRGPELPAAVGRATAATGVHPVVGRFSMTVGTVTNMTGAALTFPLYAVFLALAQARWQAAVLMGRRWFAQQAIVSLSVPRCLGAICRALI